MGVYRLHLSLFCPCRIFFPTLYSNFDVTITKEDTRIVTRLHYHDDEIDTRDLRRELEKSESRSAEYLKWLRTCRAPVPFI